MLPMVYTQFLTLLLPFMPRSLNSHSSHTSTALLKALHVAFLLPGASPQFCLEQ